MAEFMTHRMPPKQEKFGPDVGFNAMGKPIPMFRKQAGYDECLAMGIEDRGCAWSCVSGMSNALERDKPYEAMAAGMGFLDLTGTYRLMSVLLCAQDKKS